MTYSRPRTSTVNALGDPGLPGEIKVRGNSRVTVSKNGDLYDNRKPAQLIANAEASTAAVTNFIDVLTKQGSKIYKGVLEDQANVQMADLLASQDPQDLMRSTTSEQRDALRRLNPIARDRVEDWKGTFGANQYQQIYQAEQQKNLPFLSDPSRSDEEKAQRQGEIKQTALQQSGLRNVSPRALRNVAGELAKFEGNAAGLVYAETIKNQRNLDLEEVQNGLISAIGPSFLQPEADIGRVKTYLTQIIAQGREMFTPAELAQATWAGVRTNYEKLVAEGQVGQAANLARNFLKLAQSEVKTPSGEYFFDIKDERGKSLLLKASELKNRSLQAEIQDGALKGERLVGNALTQYNAATTPEQKDAVQAQFEAQVAFLPEDARRAALGSFGAGINQLNSATQVQIRNAAQLAMDVQGDSQEQAATKYDDALNSGQISIQQYAVGMNKVTNGNPDAEIYSGILQGQTVSQGEINLAVSDLVDAGRTDTNGEGSAAFSDSPDGTQDANYVRDELTKRVLTSLEEKALDARANGNPWTTKMYVDEYKNELIIQAAQFKKELLKGRKGGKTQVERINEELFYLTENLKNGPLTVKSFSPETIKRFRRNNPDKKEPTVKDLLRQMTAQMKPLTDDKGELIYTDPAKMMKEIARKSRIKDDKYGFLDKYNPLKFLMGRPQLQELDEIQGMDRIPEFDPESSKPEEKQPNESQTEKTNDENDQAQGFKRLLMNGLEALGEVVGGVPAQAGTLEGRPGILNANNTPEFAKVMSRQLPLSIKTQPLPQVAAGTPVRRVSISISNRNHPFFVAIGIAEGTRTPSGANTKAYYGHWDPGVANRRNRGTISADTGTPAQADRKWMGILSQVSATVSPVLQRLGLPANSAGWNRVMFNVLDLRVQAPGALQDFIGKLPDVIRQGVTIEAIAKARADSFINPRTGRLEASGFGNNYSRLFADQRSRAGAFDYKRRF